MQTIRFTEHTKEDQFCISIWYSCSSSSVDIKADLFFAVAKVPKVFKLQNPCVCCAFHWNKKR